MRILVTGSAGFVGSHLCDALHRDHEVYGIDNFLTGDPENWPETIQCDMTDRKALYVLANELFPEVVIHCAASYSDPDKWHRDTDTNVAGCINAAAVAKEHGAHLLYFQTILPPVSSYAISKLAGEQYLRLSGVPLTVFRMANIYGPRNRSGPIPVFYKRLTAGQPCIVVDTTRDMLFIDDLVRCVLTVVENRLEGTFDVCSGVQTPIMQLFTEVAEEMGYAVGPDNWPPMIPPNPDDVQGTVSLDNALASWKWQERVSLRDGIARTVASYREDGISQTFTHLRLDDAS